MDKFPTNDMRDKDGEYMSELEAVIDVKESKYVLLNKLRRGDGNVEEITKQLCEIDPMRKGFYHRK